MVVIKLGGFKSVSKNIASKEKYYFVSKDE